MMTVLRLCLTFVCCTIAALHAQNLVGTYAGNGTQDLVNGNLTDSRFNNPFGICKDKQGNLYIADGGNNCIRKISRQGVASTYAGTGVAGFKDGVDSLAQFYEPTGVCADDTGNVYVADFQNHRIRKISIDGIVSTVAGSGADGLNNGFGTNAEFSYPRGISIDKAGNLYVADSWNHRIRKIAPDGLVSTFAGGGNNTGVGSVGEWVDSTDTDARFYTPTGLSFDSYGNLYVADAFTHRVRKIDTNAVVTTLAGSGSIGSSGGGYEDGPGSTAMFNTLTELYADSIGNVYVGDTYNHRIRKIDVSGNVTTLAGSDSVGYKDGVDSLAQFDFTRGITVIGDSVYMADHNNHCIRVIYANPGLGWKQVTKPVTSMKVYPNPCRGMIQILTEETNLEYFMVELFEMSGKRVLYKESKNSSIDLSDQSKGVYLLKVKKENTIYCKKIVIL